MKVKSTYIPGLKIVQSKIYRDNRGLLKEVFKQKDVLKFIVGNSNVKS